MTSITLTTTRQPRSVLQQFRHALDFATRSWKQHRDEQARESMPFEIMKDIGYRSSKDENSGTVA